MAVATDDESGILRPATEGLDGRRKVMGAAASMDLDAGSGSGPGTRSGSRSGSRSTPVLGLKNRRARQEELEVELVDLMCILCSRMRA